MDLHFNKSKERSIYFSKVPTSDNRLYYFFGLDTDPLIKKNKFINYKNFIYPKMILSLNCDSLDESAICFGRKDGKIVLLMRINFDLLNDFFIHKLKNKNLIENIDGDYFINFGQFKSGIYLLKNIRNFLSNFFIDNKNYNYIKLIPRGYHFKIKGRDNHKENKDIFCERCGKKINKNYQLNKNFIGLVGNNPKICAKCFSNILVMYFYNQIHDLCGSKSYIKSLSSNPDLIGFYFDLCETTGVLSKHAFLHFQKDLEGVNKKSFVLIPQIYLIEDDLNGKFSAVNSRICDAIDIVTLSSVDRFSDDFKKKLVKHHLSFVDGWKIRDELISYSNKGIIKTKSKKEINHFINKLISGYSKKKKSKKKLKKKTNVKKTNPKKINKKKKERILLKSNELRRLTINPNGGLRANYLELLEQNSLSVENGIEFISILTDELNQKKLIEEEVETRLWQLIKDYSLSSEDNAL